MDGCSVSTPGLGSLMACVQVPITGDPQRAFCAQKNGRCFDWSIEKVRALSLQAWQAINETR